ncbi:hypothetical protein PVK06_038641 [Gossypium arboreum]|uniref:RNase H type-1 domain-containing protein n=1 Tax=Gossypium arboreum TaxID=29729 RepID=A0ABR0N1C0_GOSAR|nr:hypothetical protein PVK06_038641 [Gossypium arboreum]
MAWQQWHQEGLFGILLAELWGAFDGLDQAWKIGGHQVILELDCIASVQQGLGGGGGAYVQRRK